MKALVCEMCNSQDLIKKDGFYICQNCGTKYSVEEARKLMVEGTVKVDNTDKLSNLYQVARRARDNNDREGAAKYYDLIQIEDPTSWEASFYTTYFKAMSCKIGEIRSAGISVYNCLDTVLALVRDHVSDEAEQEKAVDDIVRRCGTIAPLLFHAAKNHYDGIDYQIRSKYKEEYGGRISAARDILYHCGDTIDSIFHDQPQIAKLAAKAWSLGVNLHKSMLPEFANKQLNVVTIQAYTKKIGIYDSSNYAELRIPQLKNIIAAQEKLLAKTPEKATFSKWALILGGFLVAFPLVAAFRILSWGAPLREVLQFPFIFLFVLGIAVIYWGRPTKAKGERNLATRKAAQEELDKAKKELAELGG